MSEPGAPVPQRIGDVERDRAAELLREHLAVGRLDQTEFEDRVGRALAARTLNELTPLFDDLPGPKPGQEVAPAYHAPPWQSAPAPNPVAGPAAPVPVSEAPPPNQLWKIIAAVAWPVTLLVCFASNWQYWWLIFIPIALSSMAGSKNRHTRIGH